MPADSRRKSKPRKETGLQKKTGLNRKTGVLKDKEEKKVILRDNQNGNSASKLLSSCRPEDIIFALDIGTRTVVGVVGVQEKDVLKIVAAEVLEHKHRAMLDGQIHDISQVAETVAIVKGRLEKSLGITLSKVAVAAAGRALKTCEVTVERETDPGREIDRELVSSIEIEAIQKAQLMLDSEVTDEGRTKFYCVGYSTIYYTLDGYHISSLIGHRGSKAGANVLATFLPHIVVDSLYTVMNRVGLDVSSLTLEPIAAINVTIPGDIRMLNLALVDIGAGTSDMVITRDGSIVAYAMVPVAGDEITESISRHYLVDFATGEKIKISLAAPGDVIAFTDILGLKHSVKPSEVMEVIRPAVEQLAQIISQKLLELNHKSPNAVFLIGGGSQVPGLTERLAEHLTLPKERIAVRGRDVIKSIRFKGRKLAGPEAITPFGIAVTACMQDGQDFLSATVNGRKIRLFNSRKLTVADALILIGYNPAQLIGRTGKGLSFTLNGLKKTIRGGHGKPAEIFINNKAANLETVLNSGDDIRIVPAEDGKDAEIRVSDLLGSAGSGNDGYRVLVNGSEVDNGYMLQDSDAVEYIKKENVKPAESDERRTEKNQAGMQDERKLAGTTTGMKAESAPAPDKSAGMPVTVNGKPVSLTDGKSQHIFVDIFNFINFDLTRPQGTIALRLNGRQAGFADEIHPGDAIEVYWEK